MQQILSRTAVKSVISNQVYIHLEWMKPIEKRIQIGIGCVDKKNRRDFIVDFKHRIHPSNAIHLVAHTSTDVLFEVNFSKLPKEITTLMIIANMPRNKEKNKICWRDLKQFKMSIFSVKNEEESQVYEIPENDLITTGAVVANIFLKDKVWRIKPLRFGMNGPTIQNILTQIFPQKNKNC